MGHWTRHFTLMPRRTRSPLEKFWKWMLIFSVKDTTVFIGVRKQSKALSGLLFLDGLVF